VRRATPALGVLGVIALTAAAPPAFGKPIPRGRKASTKPIAASAPRARHDGHDGAHARVAINHTGDLRPGRDIIGRREQPLTIEEDTAKQIEKLLRGPLRYGVTGLFVADARTGEALFAVNAEDPLNPASNVKMISTAAALELLGADFKYPTRLLGALPDAGIVHGDAYLLGSYDPTLTPGDFDDIAAAVAACGITRIDGSLVVGADPTRDGLYRSVVPIEIHAGEPGAPAIATLPAGMDLISVRMLATTGRATRSRLTYKVDNTDDGAGHPRIVLTIGGTIGRGGAASYPVVTRERTATAAYTLRAALAAHGITVGGDFKIAELNSFVGAVVAAGRLPVELGRHDSARLAEIVAHINKWSINWLADRVIMTAAALVQRQPPSMDVAVAAMYDWLDRHPRITKSDLVVDTGSGLSYHTRITPHELVSIIRSAAGYTPDGDAALSQAWLDSLSIGGTDGTLARRFRGAEIRGRLRAKTGTLSTSIALSGLLDLDSQRPLAFSLVTNGDTPLSPRYVRHAHEQVIAILCRYLARTRKEPLATPAPLPAVLAPSPGIGADRQDLEELEPDPVLDPVLDTEAASQR